jgi:hypothetical protein
MENLSASIARTYVRELLAKDKVHIDDCIRKFGDYCSHGTDELDECIACAFTIYTASFGILAAKQHLPPQLPASSIGEGSYEKVYTVNNQAVKVLPLYVEWEDKMYESSMANGKWLWLRYG